MFNFLKNLAAKPETPKADKPEGSCASDKKSMEPKKEGGCCGGHCH
jgi:hypothetical protein